MSIDTGTFRPREERLAMLVDLGVTELADRLDHMMTVAFVLGNHLADIAELVGLDRDVEDLAITPRVRELVSDPRVRQVLDEFEEARRRARRPVLHPTPWRTATVASEHSIYLVDANGSFFAWIDDRETAELIVDTANSR